VGMSNWRIINEVEGQTSNMIQQAFSVYRASQLSKSQPNQGSASSEPEVILSADNLVVRYRCLLGNTIFPADRT